MSKGISPSMTLVDQKSILNSQQMQETQILVESTVIIYEKISIIFKEAFVQYTSTRIIYMLFSGVFTIFTIIISVYISWVMLLGHFIKRCIFIKKFTCTLPIRSLFMVDRKFMGSVKSELKIKIISSIRTLYGIRLGNLIKLLKSL